MAIYFVRFINLTCLFALCGLSVIMYYNSLVTQNNIDSWDLARSETVMTDRCGEESPPQGRAWALLVTGATGFDNYFAQAPVYRIYHLLRDGGLEDKDLFVLHYDDLAGHYLNLFPGEIRQQIDGPNLYAGVPKEYTGQAVTDGNVLNILEGNSMGGGKVIQSTAEDTIFLYIVGHGAQGVGIEMPEGHFLYNEDLIESLLFMQEEKRFKSMVIYIESCHSGCIFKHAGLQKTNIYAVTSSKCSERSYAANPLLVKKMYNRRKVLVAGGFEWTSARFSCLWIRDSETQDRRKRSVGEQYQEVKKRLRSRVQHVMEYGNKGLKAEKLCNYMGYSNKRVARNERCY